MSIFKPVFGAVTLIGCAVFAHAQAPPEPARLVRLNVVAVDANGQPATGLAAGDFQITDQGKAQQVALFRGSAGAVSGQLNSNRPAAGTHVAAILLDFLTPTRTERIDAAKKLALSLKRVDSGESIYLYVLAPDGNMVSLHDIPKDPAAPPDRAWLGNIEKLIGDAVKNNNGNRPAGMSQEDAVKKTYVALETLANQLSAFPGRRDILWVNTWPPNVMNPQVRCTGDWRDCALYLPHLIVTLDRAGVVVNPFSYVSAGVDASRTLEEMAGLTGGRAYLSHDAGEVLKQFGAQGDATYSIAYAPAADNWDSTFHKLKVSCERKGVRLQARQRYYAVPDQRTMAMRQQSLMVAAYQSPSDTSEIGLRATVSPGGSPDRIRVNLQIDPADLRGDRITLVFSARAANGPQGEPTLADLQLHRTPESGMAVSQEYPIDAATQKIRLIVCDRATDAVGAVTVPIVR